MPNNRNTIKIEGLEVGEESRTLIIAEAGINHQGKVENAINLIKAAKKSGADAVKFQALNPDTMVDKRLLPETYEIYKKNRISTEDYKELLRGCISEGILFISTVFDEEGADFLESIGVKSFKVSSYDLTNIPLLIYLAKKGLPIILSTGLSNMVEVENENKIYRNSSIVSNFFVNASKQRCKSSKNDVSICCTSWWINNE